MKYPDNFLPNIYDGDNKVRYCLGKDGNKVLICISINPNFANNLVSDPTMNSLVNVAHKHNYDGYIMINPAPYRSSKPEFLPENADNCINKNLDVISWIFKKYEEGSILCGWGDYPIYKAPAWYINSLNQIMKLAQQHNMKLLCIKQNKSGQPTHLNYLNRDHKSFNNGKGNYDLNQYIFKEIR